MRRAVVVLGAALLAGGALAAIAPSALADAPTTVYVDPAGGGSDHDGCAGPANACGTIGYALSVVAPGGTVNVQPATYDEAPDVEQSVTLIGHDATIDSLTIGDAAGAVDVHGFTVSSAATPLVAINDSNPGVQISVHDNTLTGGANPQTAVAVSDNSADVAITHNVVTATTSGVALTGTEHPAVYAVTDNAFAITEGSGAAITLAAPGVADVLGATVTGNTGTISATGRAISESGAGAISVSAATPNRLHAENTSITVAGAPGVLTTLEPPTPFTATVTSGSTVDGVLDVTVSAPPGTTADELTLGENLDGGATYAGVPLLGTGPFHATIALPELDAQHPAVVHLDLAAADGAAGGPLSMTLDLDETGTDGSVLNTAAETPLSMQAVVNSPPTATPQSISVDHGAAKATIDLSSSVSDADHDPLTFAIVTNAAHGTATVDPVTGIASYAPAADFGGTDTFTYTVNDGWQDSLPATVTLSVDSPPTATVTPQAPHVALGASVALQLNATDVDGDVLGYWVGRPSHGSVRRSRTLLTYTAPSDWAGEATFPFSAKDGHGGKATGTAEVIVDRAATTLRLSVSPTRPTAAQHPSLTVHVSSAGNPDGLVTVGNTTTRARHGIATFSLPTYTGGVHTVSAAFNGTLTAEPVSRAATTFTVTRVASSLAMTTDPLQLTTRTKNATATIRVGAGPLTADSGAVTIDENGHRLASGTVRGGSVTVHLPRFTLGQHNLTVTYSGTDQIAPSSVVRVERVSLGR